MPVSGRQLLSGWWVPVLACARRLQVHTRVPEKYCLIDLETGQYYRGRAEGAVSWRLLDPTERARIRRDLHQLAQAAGPEHSDDGR